MVLTLLWVFVPSINCGDRVCWNCFLRSKFACKISKYLLIKLLIFGKKGLHDTNLTEYVLKTWLLMMGSNSQQWDNFSTR